MDDFVQFFRLIQVTDLSWGWKAMMFYASIFIIFVIITMFQMIIGTIAVFRRLREVPAEDSFSVLRSNSLPPITFIIPAYNESTVIVHTVKNFLSLSYRYKKIVVINDGSTDSTLELLKTNFYLRPVPPTYKHDLETKEIQSYYASEEYPNLLVIDKVNGGKADALNAGLNACTTDIFVAADADTLVVDEALNKLVRPFLVDPETQVAHASIGLLNGCKIGHNRILDYRFPKKLIPGMQALDFMKSFLVERVGLSWTKGALVVPGNFGLFKKDIILELGGYNTVSLVEDTEIITHMHEYLLRNKRDYKITYLSDIVAWTQAPETVETLINQRLRWYIGTTQNIWWYRHMWFNPKYKSIGLFICPMTVFEKIAPLIEISGFVILLLAAIFSKVGFVIVLGLAFASWLYGLIMVVFTLLIDSIAFNTFASWKDFPHILKCLAGYTGYHYLLAYCRIKGLYVPESKRAGWEPQRIRYEKM